MTAEVLPFRDQDAALRDAIERYARRSAPKGLTGEHLARFVRTFTETTLAELGSLNGSRRDHRLLIRQFEVKLQ